MKFGVVVFPGSNCDDDMVYALGEVMGAPVEKIWHKEKDLSAYEPEDCIVIPGGFSYGDYLRSGAIARYSPIMKAVGAFAQKGGRVLGICNGFQVLCESKLLPGTLLRNQNQKFISKVCHLKTITTRTQWTQACEKDQVISMPIAHAEGRYYCDPETLDGLRQKDQILFKYCSPHGDVSSEYNWNGSLESIAGICNEGRNVFGMMPHPERSIENLLGADDGRILFEGLLGLVAHV